MVKKNVLLFLAGFLWLGVGSMLVVVACLWLEASSGSVNCLFVVLGVLLSLLIHKFGFSKIADKNSKRIVSMQGKQSLFSFIPPRSYFIIAIMALLGRALRHSSISRQYLAVIYIGIGFALILSGLRYRFFAKV